MNVADTVRNRIEKLENQGIIKHDTIDVDYGRTDIQHHYRFLCTGWVDERERLVHETQNIQEIVRTTNVLTGT